MLSPIARSSHALRAAIFKRRPEPRGSSSRSVPVSSTIPVNMAVIKRRASGEANGLHRKQLPLFVG